LPKRFFGAYFKKHEPGRTLAQNAAVPVPLTFSLYCHVNISMLAPDFFSGFVTPETPPVSGRQVPPGVGARLQILEAKPGRHVQHHEARSATSLVARLV
jgi:hypothetical protein